MRAGPGTPKDPSPAHELREILNRIGQASGPGREEEVAEWCDRLIDVLLDLEG